MWPESSSVNAANLVKKIFHSNWDNEFLLRDCFLLAHPVDPLSWNSMGPTPTPSRTSSSTSAQGFSHISRHVRLLPHSACHEPDTHDDPHRLVRRLVWRELFLARMSVRDARVYKCKRVLYTISYRTRLQNYTIGASLVGVGPMDSSFISNHHHERHQSLMPKLTWYKQRRLLQSRG